MSPSYRSFPDRFLVAFSFAGEQRKLVRSIAEAVEQQLSLGSVFYDSWFEQHLAGLNADIDLQRIYKKQAELIVVCFSREYGEKPWTLTEWDTIRARHMKLRSDPNNEESKRILPLRVAEGDVEGLLENAIWIDARKHRPNQTAGLIVRRLREFVPDAGKPRVFLAECTPDLEDESKPVNRQKLQLFLEEELDCIVMPRSPLTEQSFDEYKKLMREDLQQCLAFIQLLGPYPWKTGGFDRLQHEAAVRLDMKSFRFRGEANLDNLKKTNQEQYRFLIDAIAGGFEDFKDHLRKELPDLARRQKEDVKRMQMEERAAENIDQQEVGGKPPPLVRVVYRSGNPRALWEQIFPLIDKTEDILPDELRPGDTLLASQKNEPCHGFLILCDEAALMEEKLTPRDYLAQCRQVQMEIWSKEKNLSQCPPVGLVYWPPPPVSWSWLLRTKPQKLYRVLGANAIKDLDPFFEEVRHVWESAP